MAGLSGSEWLGKTADLSKVTIHIPSQARRGVTVLSDQRRYYSTKPAIMVQSYITTAYNE